MTLFSILRKARVKQCNFIALVPYVDAELYSIVKQKL